MSKDMGREELLQELAYLDQAEYINKQAYAQLRKIVEQSGFIESALRRELWMNHGCPFAALYGDDGEMQCGQCLVDFKRMPIADLVQKIADQRLTRAALEIAKQADTEQSPEPGVDEEMAGFLDAVGLALEHVNWKYYARKATVLLQIKQLLRQKPQAEQSGEVDEVNSFLADLREIVDGSNGIDGWHLNGDIATWGEIDITVDRIDELLTQQPQKQTVTREEILSVVKRINDEITPGGMTTARMVEIAYEELGIEVKEEEEREQEPMDKETVGDKKFHELKDEGRLDRFGRRKDGI